MTELLTRIALAMVVASSLWSCGGESGGTAPLPPETINGIAVPPAQASPDTGTLKGIDSNANGVRDEVERAIATSFGADKLVYTAAFNLGRFYQTWYETAAPTEGEAKALLSEEFRLAACVYQATGRDQKKSSTVTQEVRLRTFSTVARQNTKHAIYSQASGASIPSGEPRC